MVLQVGRRDRLPLTKTIFISTYLHLTRRALKSNEFVEKAFRSYYAENPPVIAPIMMEKREFGFVLQRQGMLRHKSFQNKTELEAFLRVSAPMDVYYSCAYYEDPEAEMEKKGWLGADLIFDIDADHIPTSCGKVHDEWACGNCNFVGKGLTPEVCPVCGGQKFNVKTWPCQECLDSAKVETVKLLDMLMQDFGFSDREVHVFFSGHRGYHVHVESGIVKALDAVARKEVVDYVCGLGLDTGFHDLVAKKSGRMHLPNSPRLGDLSWRGRLAKGMYDLVLNANQEDYRKIGLNRKVIDTLIRNKDAILRNWNDIGPFRAVKGLGFETWKKIVEYCEEYLPAKIDTVVTTDTHRLIRLTGTLHGKTGLKKVEFPVSQIEFFDPFKSAVAFKKETAPVLVSDAPRFRLGDETFGPYKNQRVELPTAAAMLLVCKGRAEVVE
jgi:DNA primase small subunit